MTLYIDSTVREDSRTQRLADRLASRIADGEVRTIRLQDEHLHPFDAASLDQRNREIESGKRDSQTLVRAAEFAAADQIVMAAPFWDLSFPALLKTYVEWINVLGVVFRYSDDGHPVGLCRARRLFYVSTSGGPAETDPFGFGYVATLAKNYWGIPEVRRIAATGLDIVGADVESILRSAEAEIDKVEP
ncbi:MAG: NAD(P)H-dependent oxidoreductase [Kiritimatiellae bacterium]|nr:NAD(P)H-dependent oxidoreductase [Kiritimatiellia bacterium]